MIWVKVLLLFIYLFFLDELSVEIAVFRPWHTEGKQKLHIDGLNNLPSCIDFYRKARLNLLHKVNLKP